MLTWENYALILTGGASDLFLPALRNSFGISPDRDVHWPVLLSMFAAYAIARLDFPGKRLILTTALAVAIFPVISIVTPLFNLWRQIGLYDTWPGLIIPYLSLTLPISIWTLSAFFREIPWEMEQAAQVDGATTWQAFRKVIVPLAAPGVFTTAIIAFFIAWNDFVYGISLTSTGAARPVPAALALFTGASQFEEPDRRHLGRRRHRHHPGGHPRPAVPAAHRRRPDQRCGQGLKESSMAPDRAASNIVKKYGDGFPAVNDVSLDIADGEFMILVGPSGCGKSTLLRMVVGLEDITSGDMIIGGKRVNDKAPRDRNLSMVFQNYALYPHLTVFENIAFPLRLARRPPEEEVHRASVTEAADVLELHEHLERKPANLSGGQRQRVAMGRAIVRQADAFLFDEPLSNLDAKLRGQMRTEISRLQRRLGHHHRLRHPRPDRGDDAGRPGRGAAQGHAPAGRLARASSTSSRSTCSSPGSSARRR